MKQKNSGFIYPIVNCVLNNLRHLSLVEPFKGCARLIGGRNRSREELRADSRIAIDIFILTKFAIVLASLCFGLSHCGLTLTIGYLLSTNLYTYFFYHIWSVDVQDGNRFNTERVKSRFMNLMLAILFSILGFAYLYLIPFSSGFIWASGKPNISDALFFSARTSFIAGYEPVVELTRAAHALSTAQLLTTFFFFTIILNNSIPQSKNAKE